METRNWLFVPDMNTDGIISLGDVWQWFLWLFFYPGDLFIRLFLAAGMENLLYVIEPTSHFYGGLVAGIFACMCWLALFRIFE